MQQWIKWTALTLLILSIAATLFFLLKGRIDFATFCIGAAIFFMVCLIHNNVT